jgi:uncharacterized protein
MKTLVCSDIHDHVENLVKALELSGAAACGSILCLGDLCAPFIIDVFHENTELPVHIIFGNNDGDRFNMLRKSEAYNKTRNARIVLHGEHLIKKENDDLEGFPVSASFSANHYPDLSRIAADTGLFQFVFFGHTHKTLIEQHATSLLVNPGSLMGYTPSAKARYTKPTCIIIDWHTLQTDLIEL